MAGYHFVQFLAKSATGDGLFPQCGMDGVLFIDGRFSAGRVHHIIKNAAKEMRKTHNYRDGYVAYMLFTNHGAIPSNLQIEQRLICNDFDYVEESIDVS